MNERWFQLDDSFFCWAAFNKQKRNESPRWGLHRDFYFLAVTRGDVAALKKN